MIYLVNADNTNQYFEYSYDAWGRMMRNTANWNNYSPGSEPVLFVAGRGFTGHEHLPWFNLINMNGRLYDPLTAQFLSPDNYVQDPTFTQNYNRYIYCLNNPLKYVDPSGYKQLKSWEEFWEVINNLMDYGGSWNSETGYSDGRQGGSIEGYGVISGSGFHGPDQPYMLPGFEVTAKAPQKNTPTTPIIDNNNDPFRFDKNDPAGQGGSSWFSSTNTWGWITWGVSAVGDNAERGANAIKASQSATAIYTNKLYWLNQDKLLISTFNPTLTKVASAAKWAGIVGNTGGLVVSIINISNRGWTIENTLDLGFSGISYIPGYGWAISLGYMGAKTYVKEVNNNSGYWSKALDTYTIYGFNCFAKGTLVLMGDGSNKNIESVQIGDTVLTYNFIEKKLEKNPVVKVDAPIHNQLIKVVFSNGEEIISTEDHPYYVKGKGLCSFNPQQTLKNYGIKTKQLVVSNYCLTFKSNRLKKVKVTQIVSFEESIKTYNLTKIANSNNYFVNGILVNNESNIFEKQAK